MSDPDPEEIERWLQSLDPNDPTVRVYDIEPLTVATEQFHNAVADARERGVPLQLIGLLIEDLEDRLSVLLRTGETIPARELWRDLGIGDQVAKS
jgi:hypothetical protein